MGTVNPDSLKSILFSNFDSRKKRQADGLIEVTEEDFAEFLGDFADFKDDVASKMSNLTCVLSKSFPQSALNKNPIMKVFGRHMVFFKCTKKVEAHCCGMACANHMLETLYGDNDQGYNWAQHGLPNNKYERAAMYVKVQYGTATPEEKFVHNFFYMDPAM